MKHHALKKFLDKRKTVHLLQAFLDSTPELSACWVIDMQGDCFLGYPQKTTRQFGGLPDNGAEFVISDSVIGIPLILDEKPAGMVAVQRIHPEEEPSHHLLHSLRYLGITLIQMASLGREKREILEDALDKYREITLLYTIGATINSKLEVDQITTLILATIKDMIKTENSSIMLLNKQSQELEIKAASGAEHTIKPHLKKGEGIAGTVVQTGKPEIVNDTLEDPRFIQKMNSVRSLLCVPLKVQENILGVINVSNKLSDEMFTARDEKLLMTLASQAAVCIANAQNYEKIKRKNLAFERFVPTEFLRCLAKTEVEDITLGEVSNEELAVLFSDIRSFTTLSESMTPEENFRFLNNYLRYIGPEIERHGGFIDKYIGDAIMALFAGQKNSVADDSIAAALGMLEQLKVYNRHRRRAGYHPIQIGIGIHSGSLMLGTIGFERRMETTVIGDTVNLASRMEGLTKQYGIAIGVTSETLRKAVNADSLLVREIDTVKVKGKEKPITVYEIFNADPENIQEQKIQLDHQYVEALQLYKNRNWREAVQLFTTLRQSLPTDKVIEIYCERCQAFLEYPPNESWSGVTRLREK